MNFIAVILMGGAGAAARYAISLQLPGEGESGFPLSTLLVNVIGCFLLAAVLYLPLVYPKIPRWVLNGLGSGFLGAFTTFSAFSTENASLLLNGAYFTVFLYVSASLLAGLGAAWVGFHACRLLFRRKAEQGVSQKAEQVAGQKTVQKDGQITVRERI